MVKYGADVEANLCQCEYNQKYGRKERLLILSQYFDRH
jgi:hypothetical protein